MICTDAVMTPILLKVGKGGISHGVAWYVVRIYCVDYRAAYLCYSLRMLLKNDSQYLIYQ